MIPIASIERVVRKAGIDRISLEALKELQTSIEDLATELTVEVTQLASHAHRKTIQKEDIILVSHKK